MEVKPDINVKIGGGLSIYINKSRTLRTGFYQKWQKEIRQDNGNIKQQNTAETPDKSGGSKITKDTDISQKIQFQENKVSILENRSGYNITGFVTFEVEKRIRPYLTIYGGADLGIDIGLNLKIFESSFYNLNYEQNKAKDQAGSFGEEDYRYLIEIREKYLPRFKWQKEIRQGNGNTKKENTAETPNNSGGSEITKDTDISKQIPFQENAVSILENRSGYNITGFVTFEVEKRIRPYLTIYGGADLGIDVGLNLKIFESTFYNMDLSSKKVEEDIKGEEDIRYLIERREKYLPRVKGYFVKV